MGTDALRRARIPKQGWSPRRLAFFQSANGKTSIEGAHGEAFDTRFPDVGSTPTTSTIQTQAKDPINGRIPSGRA